MNKKNPHPEFAQRMAQACDGNPSVPLPNYGRLGWFVEEMSKKGVNVTQETIRKWSNGEALPRKKSMTALASVLKVSEAWLALGKMEELPEKAARLRNAAADGAVNLVAGLVQMSGGRPAFPLDDDKFATKNKVDLYAIIRGAQYAIHVVVFDPDGKVAVPVEAKDALILGVVNDGEFRFRVFELDWEHLEMLGKRKGGFIEVDLAAHGWRQVTSFQERL